ncbi:MAG: protein kinase [Thermoanaerobaculia bacterium]
MGALGSSTPLLEEVRDQVGDPGPTPRLLAGTIINGRYRLEECLGEGGMGVVYRVVDPLHPERRVALKSIRRSLVHPALIGRFKAEFRNLTQLQHPNVAAAYDFEEMRASDDYFFTMELVEGRDVLRTTEEAPWQLILDLLVQVCRALSYVHSRKLIHYDIKPANVVVGDHDHVKVLDFGLASAKTIGSRGQWGGTPAYMAPELTDPEAFVDHRADLYSLGIMAYHLLCRRLPFEGRTHSELFRMHRFEALEFSDSDRQGIPSWLPAVIERLCAKHPADRYPTANAVIEDINRHGGLEYELETLETRESYVFSSRFVNRHAEYDRVNDFVSRRIRGSPGFPPVLMVGGSSGSGKSRLLREVRHDAQLSQVSFCQGRCFEGDLSDFQPLVPVLELLIRLAESLDGPDLVGEYGPELVKICPSLGKLRNTEPSAPLAQVHQESTRLREAVTDFLVRIAGMAPYVVYVDDLQWARAGLTELLADLVHRIAIAERGGKPVPVAVLGAYRDEEIAGRPVEALREALKGGGNLEDFTLDSLGGAEVSEMVGSMLGSGELPETFADRIARETGGNPFFVEELMRALVENGVVYLAAGAWKVRDEVGRVEIPRTVAAVFRRRAAMLDDDQRALLEAMAVCGRPAAADVLAHATRLDSEDAHAALTGLIDRHMVQEVPGPGLRFRLSHDRLRETIYGDLERSARAKAHWTMARSIEAVYARELEEHIFELADHYNSAEELLTESEERQKAANYNQLAGRRSKISGAFDAAGKYLRSAMALLPDDCWATDYDRVATVSRDLMEVEYLGRDLERAERHWQRHVAQARTSLEKAEAYIVKVDALAHLGRLQEALATFREALPLFQVRYRTHPGLLSVVLALLRTKRSLRHRSFAELLALEDLGDPEKNALLRLLSSSLFPAFTTYQENLFSYYSAKAVQLAAKWGNAPAASVMYGAYAFARQQAFGDLETAAEIGEFANELARRYDDPAASGRAFFMTAAFVFPWSRPLPTIAPLLLAGYRQSSKGGDLLFAGFHLNVLITQQCMYSESVDATLRLLAEHEDLLLRLDNPHTINEIRALRQMLRQLSGQTRNRATFDDDDFDEGRFVKDLLELDDPIPISFYFTFKLKALFLMGLYDRAFELSREADKRVGATRGQYVFAEQAFFHFLTVARRLEAAGRIERVWLRRSLDKKRKLMKKWADVCPENFHHKLLLMEAERARLEGDWAAARRLYQGAVTSAREAGFPLNATVACELAGRFELAQDRQEEAVRWLSAARDGYATWGASAKVAAMEEELSARV